MSTLRLNAAAIAANTLPVGVRSPGIADLISDLESRPVVVTRRDVLKAAGVVATVATGALSIKSLQPIESPEAGATARAAWLRAGSHRTVLDPALFSGSPRLTVSENGQWAAALSGARFPGTTVPADVSAIISGAGARARVRLTHVLGDFRTEVGLSDWLAGRAEAASTVGLAGTSLDLGEGVVLEFAGRAVATLASDWSYRIAAPGGITLAIADSRLVADAVTIALAGAAPTLLSRRVARRTLVTLESGAARWSIPAPLATARGAVELPDGLFDSLTLEAAETRAGVAYRAFVAQSAPGAIATYVPRGKAAAHGALPLRLTDVRYAGLLDGGGDVHLAARFADEAVWMAQAGRALLVGGAAWAPPFELKREGGRVSLSARPALHAISPPFEGALASPLTFADGVNALLNLGDAATGGGMSASALVPGPIIGPIIDVPIGPIVQPIELPSGTSLTVVRPDDMLTLRFEFYNMSLVSDAQGTRLVRQSSRLVPHMTVRFPAQHVLEQAILDPQSVAAQLKTPLKAYLSDESRLSFRVSDARINTGIAYSLAGLLDWSGFSHRVVPAAQRITSGTDLTASMREPLKGDPATGVVPETSLELPWGLILSPYEEEWWSHRKAAFTRGGRTELWHTRLRGGFLPGAFASAAAATEAAAISPIFTTPVLNTGTLVNVLNPGNLVGIIDPGQLTPGLFVRETSPTLRAVWGRFYANRLAQPNATALAPPTAGLFRNSFTDGVIPDPMPSGSDVGGIGNRWSVIDLSGRFRREPVGVNRLMLTSLGAWLDSSGKWDIAAVRAAGMPVFGNVTQWDHRATMGRDQYVKVVKIGRIFPFGHRAVQITITERRVDPATGLAFLGQKAFIEIKEPTRSYAQEGTLLKRRMPFKSVTFKTLSTPQIEARTVLGISVSHGYWIKSVDTGSDFLFKMQAVDWDGVTQTFEMPLIFVHDNWASNYAPTFTPNNDAARPVLESCANAIRTVNVQFKSQPVAFARTAASSDAARVMPTNWIRFDAQVYAPATTVGDPRFEPFMFQANVRLDAVEELTGQNAGTTIRIAEIYQNLGYGGGNAAGRVFAEIVSAPTVGFPAAITGALATPVPKFTGISAVKGTFGSDLAQFGAGTYSPSQFFDALNAKILGGVKLIDILGAALGLNEMPVFEKVKDALDSKTLVVRYAWETRVTKDALIFLPQPGCKLKLSAEVRKSLEDTASPPSFKVTGELGSFKLHLVKGVFDAVILTFTKITFVSENGGAPKVDPQISNVEFGGDLKYLAKLAEYLGALGGAGSGSSLAARAPDGLSRSAATLVDAGPLKIDVTGEGVKASLTIAIPDLTIGVFSLKNMSFYAALMLPFNGSPVTLDFAFCSRESPFELLVMGFGGGGYVLMTFDPAGMKALEISLEFGAGMSFSIGGIASGSVEIKGGLSVRYERLDVGEKLDFVVFIRIHGSLKIMGIVRVTLTFYLELRYQTFPKKSNPAIKGDKLTGTATLTIEIEILFFTIPVKLSVTKELAGDDPRFGDAMPLQADWDAYCEAFAPAQLGA